MRRSRTPAALGIAGGAPVGLSLPTRCRRIATIASCHATEELETPTEHPLVRRLLRRYSRTRGTAGKKKDRSPIDDALKVEGRILPSTAATWPCGRRIKKKDKETYALLRRELGIETQ